MLLSLGNCFLLIATKLGQRVARDSHIHYRVILNPQALLPSRWASKLAQFHGTLWRAHKCRTNFHLVVYDASHPSTLQTNLGPSLAQWTLSMATRGRATTSIATPSMATKGGATTSKTKKTNTVNLM
jgi:hypothetical protein